LFDPTATFTAPETGIGALPTRDMILLSMRFE
jgi:hypothetical protein